jgi:hypothetical protein
MLHMPLPPAAPCGGSCACLGDIMPYFCSIGRLIHFLTCVIMYIRVAAMVNELSIMEVLTRMAIHRSGVDGRQCV